MPASSSSVLFHPFVTPSSSYSSVSPLKLYKPQLKRFLLHFGLPKRSRTFLEHSSFSPLRKTRVVVEERINGEEPVYPQNDDAFADEEEHKDKKLGKACEVYLCNLPRSSDAADLLDMFRPYGTILSVELPS